MIDFISVILPSFNPNISRLNQTLLGLQRQTLPLKHWELIIVDNNSSPKIEVDLSWHINHHIIIAGKAGLTHARLKGFHQAQGNIIIMVDDDNILSPQYLQSTSLIFKNHPQLGAAGGKSIGKFDITPPDWLKNFHNNLALRDLGELVILKSWENEYPAVAPIGAGMAIRKQSLQSYLEKTMEDNTITDRIGNSLTSGGDNEIVLEILKSGWQVGYFPQLVLRHIIPRERMSVKYLARLVNNTNQSWAQLLTKHNINPWAPISPLGAKIRKIKAFFTCRPWVSKSHFIKWRGACGTFSGLIVKR
jgi:glycosyltransferase involved in cell wall biosynthesis